MSFLEGLKEKFTLFKDQNEYLNGFRKTGNFLNAKLDNVLSNANLDDDFMERLMVTLIECDLGYKTAQKICDKFYNHLKNYPSIWQLDLMDILTELIANTYKEVPDTPISYNDNGPTVILMVGVNGSGKTSTIAKLAKMYLDEGKKVAVVAGDTFRAGAVKQLNEWAKRLNIDIVAGKENMDPSAVLVDGCRFAKSHDIDILLCDTAGRLQNKANLMAELAKMKRVVAKEIVGAPHNTWLVLDANTGQNGLSQALLFNEVTKLDGIILTKMDGTSKGGIVIAIKDNLGIPVKFITFGEGVDDLKAFDLDAYLYAIIGEIHEH